MPKTAANRVPAAVPFRSDDAAVTIGRLGRAAEVGVETVRYYQRRRLLAVPHSGGGVRRYPIATIDRIRFIKRSQDLGFSLEEIRELMCLEQAAVAGPFARLPVPD
jgi:DNA-binding transcriptional MerR regulator